MRVPGAQGGDGSLPLRASLHHFRASLHEDVAEARPVFVVGVEDEGDVGVLRDVAQALQPVRALGLFIDRYPDGAGVQREADGDDVRTALRVCGGQVRETLT